MKRRAKDIRVLVACEFSGIVREEFSKLGFDVWSCDLLDSEIPSGNHLKCNVLDVLSDGWDLMIAHPPCTYLCVSGARWFKYRQQEQEEALQFVADLMLAPVLHIALENPVSVISTRIRKPDQIIQPWWFGHPETKATCLWLEDLPYLDPYLHPENITYGDTSRVHYASPGPGRWKERSRTYVGIAKAMAEQWGNYLLSVGA